MCHHINFTEHNQNELDLVKSVILAILVHNRVSFDLKKLVKVYKQ